MNSDLRRRIASAREDLDHLTSEEVNRYLDNVRRSDPELAQELDWLPRIADHAGKVPTVSNVGKATNSWEAQAPPSTSAAGTQAGRTLGRFELIRVVGRGGFGEVWQAFDPVLKKHVALKVPTAGRPHGPATFLREAQKASSLRHPAIVQVYDVGESPNGWYIVSEFIAGQSLRQRIDAGRVPFVEAVRVAEAVAGALHAAHLAGIVHRDVKPGNILLDAAGNAYLADFGLAADEAELLKERDRISGTFAYMSPEQIRGDTHMLDGRADIYSLGAVLYELLTGRRMFRADDFDGYQEMIQDREPRPLRSVDDAIPAELERICLRCVEKEVRDRYTTARDLADDLRAWLARSVPVPPVPPPVRGRFVLAGALAALALWFALAGGGPPATVSPTTTAVHPFNGPPTPVLEKRVVPIVKALVWPSDHEACKWEVLPATNQLRVYVDSVGVLQLGETDADSWDLSMTITQLNPVGRVGVFIGHRKDPATLTARFEVVHLAIDTGQPLLKRSIDTYKYDKGYANPTFHTSESVKLAAIATTNDIRVVVRGGRLAEIWLNGRADPGMLVGSVRPKSPGGFGVFVQNSDAVVSKVFFNREPVPLFAEAAKGTPENP